VAGAKSPGTETDAWVGFILKTYGLKRRLATRAERRWMQA